MRVYDYDKALRIVSEDSEIVSAKLGMLEDWFYTAETIYENGVFNATFLEKCPIMGLTESCWATPALLVTMADGSEKTIECYTGESEDEEFTKGPKEFALSTNRGCLSGPCQDYIDKLPREK